MKLSVVTTLYRSRETVDAFYTRMIAAAKQVVDDFEIVMVNDGSPDDSLERAAALQASDPRLVVVDLARNFGHHKAMMTGLQYARGELVFLIDSDLEEEPELLTAFHARMLQGDCDVVYGVQAARRGGLVERVTGALFFRLADALSDQKLPRNLATVRLMTRDYVRALLRHRDREFVISHLWATTGYRQVALSISKLAHSPTSYSLRRRIHMAVAHITTTSTALLHLVFYFGLFVAAAAVVAVLYFIGRYLWFGVGVDGWTSLIVSVWFFGGLTTLILGILGIYLARVLSETRRRPYTIVRRVMRASAAGAPSAALPGEAKRSAAVLDFEEGERRSSVR